MTDERPTWLRAAGHRAVQLLVGDPGLAAKAKGRIYGISREGIAMLAGVSPATYRTARNRGWIDEDDPYDVLRWVLAQRRARAHPDYEAAGIAERAELLRAADEQARAAVAKIRRILAEFG